MYSLHSSIVFVLLIKSFSLLDSKRSNVRRVECVKPKPSLPLRTKVCSHRTNHCGLRKSKTKIVKDSIIWCMFIKATIGKQKRMAIGNSVHIYSSINLQTSNPFWLYVNSYWTIHKSTATTYFVNSLPMQYSKNIK